jgi:hypothetical protein
VEQLFEQADETIATMVASAHSSDDAMGAAGAFRFWKAVKDDVQFLIDKELQEIKRRKEQWNARRSETDA